jgi:integrase
LWATDKKVRGKRISQRHCIERQRTLDTLIILVLGKEKLTNITALKIKSPRNDLYNKNYSGSLINKVLSTLKTILEYAEERHLIQFVPKIERAADNAQHKGILTPEEVRRLFIFQWDSYIGYVGNKLAACTGLRLGEIQALTIPDIRDNYINVWRSWDNALHTFNKTTKTGKERNIFIPQTIKNDLNDLISVNPYKNGFVFFSHKQDRPAGQRLFTGSFYRALDGIGINAQQRKERNITFHSHRHFFNSLLVNSKIPLQKVQSITGHVTHDMSQHYYHLDDMKDVILIQENLFK